MEIHRSFRIAVMCLLCFSLLWILPSSLRALIDPPTATWIKTYGGTQWDEPYSVIQTSDGGHAVAGCSNSSGAGDFDFWLVKIDSAGNHLWNKTYGGTGEDCAYSVVQVGGGGYAIAGYTYSYGAGTPTYSNFWLVMTDSAGNHLWNKTCGGTKDDYAYSIVQTGDGGYAIAGTTYSYGVGFSDFWLVKTDAGGNVQWNQTYGGANADEAYTVVQTGDGGYALAGYTVSFGLNGDFWLVKTDASGNKLWSTPCGGSSYEYCMSMVQTGDGGYAMVGYTGSSGAGSDDFWLVKTDSSGNMQWNRTYGGVDRDFANSVVHTVDGGYALAGSTFSFGSGEEDFWMVKTDSAGNQQWNKTWGGASYDYSWFVMLTREGGYLVGGSTGSFGEGSSDFMLVKLPPTQVEDSVPPVTEDDYDFLTHYREFTITLTSTDDLSGVAETYYRINDGPLKGVRTVGQPFIVTEGTGNVLEYWSVDNVGNEESHHLLTGIRLDLSDHTKPIAEAGANQSVLQGITVTFNGSESADDIGIETFSWLFSDVTLRMLTGLTPSYTFNNTGNFEVTLNVTDYAGNWNTDTTWVNVLADTVSPGAEAGSDQTVNEGAVLHLDGSASSDNVRVTSYRWDFGDQSSAIGVAVTHVYSVPGDYVVTLTVEDVAGNVASDTLVVRVLPVQRSTPLADLLVFLVAGLAVVIGVVVVFFLLRRRGGFRKK